MGESFFRFPDTFSQEEMELLLDEMVKQIFSSTFERAFGAPDEAILKKIKQTHFFKVKDWIPNIVGAEHPDDVFVSPLEIALSRYTAGVVNRKHGGRLNVEKVRKLKDLEAHLKQLIDEQNEKQQKTPGYPPENPEFN